MNYTSPGIREHRFNRYSRGRTSGASEAGGVILHEFISPFVHKFSQRPVKKGRQIILSLADESLTGRLYNIRGSRSIKKFPRSVTGSHDLCTL